MNRILISDNLTPHFSYPTTGLFYRKWSDLENDYSRLIDSVSVRYFGNDFGEGEEYQLVII